ncbi:MAG: formylglycine-generating enzyme family protein [Burkholderiaceae bacterium]|nr:formylglycine-generating enzyme family protein [Burkholderiaceae bacterium]
MKCLAKGLGAKMIPGLFLWLSLSVGICGGATAETRSVGAISQIHGLQWDIHEITIGQVKQMSKATGFVSQAEREGGGYVYETGWTKKSGWNWRSPFGAPGNDNEPAVHLTFDEAQHICKFFGKRLPTDSEWTKAAYLEQRDNPPAGFIKGKRYTYPSGDSASASHCLNGCGNYKGTAPAGSLNRGVGHVPVMTTPAGVNGLYEMGGNVWEWVDTGPGNERITRSSSWWYGAERQLETDIATKPRDTRVVYIGFRCVR